MAGSTKELPIPSLRLCDRQGISFLTDDALFDCCGVRVAFTQRHGGVSVEPYDSLNLGAHVGDDPNSVNKNRRRVLDAIGASTAELITLNQVHGNRVVCVEDTSVAEIARARVQAEEGADAIVVGAKNIAPMLCFADCTPVIIVSPSGAFALAHCGWRGVVAHVALEATSRLQALDARQLKETTEIPAISDYSIYIGPRIGACCFEVGEDVRELFSSSFGADVVRGENVDMGRAIEIDLQSAGANAARIANCGLCTVCNSDDYYSYRASGGICGRHGAVAVREC